MNHRDSARRARAASRVIAIVGVLVTLLTGAVATGSPATASTTSPSAPVTSAASSGSAAAAANKATFGIGPASATGIDGRPYLNYLASAGAHLTDHVAVVNIAAHPVTLNLYVADAVVGSDGQFGYQPRAAARVDAAAWIVPGHSTTLTLGPQSKVILPVTIVVPSSASPGDHAAGIIVSLTSQITSKQGEKVNFEQRVALRTFIRVSGVLHAALAIQKLHATYHGTLNPVGGGTVTVTYRVVNTGNLRLGSHQNVTVSGLFGSSGPAHAIADIPLLLPGSFQNVTVTIKNVFPQVRLHARVSLYPLTVVGDVDPAIPGRISSSTGVWAMPWVLIALVLVLGGGFAVWRYTRRRRGPRAPASHKFPRGKKPSGPNRASPVKTPEPSSLR